MIVMVIIGLSVSLIGPNIFNSIDRQPVNIERQMLKKRMGLAVVMAFSREQALDVKFSGKIYSIYSGEIKLKSFDVDYLFFDEQEIRVSRTGFVSQNKISYTSNRQVGTLDLDLPLAGETSD